MVRVHVSYRVKPSAVETVRQAIVEFVDSVRANEPATIYGAFATEDGRSFVHAMAFPDEETEQRHRTAEHTKKFVSVLYPNCEEEPEITKLDLVRSTKKGGGFLGMG